MNVSMIDFPTIRLHVSSWIDYKRRKAAVKEPETVDWLRNCLRLVGPYTLLDIGANVGGYSLIACALDPRNCAVAVEPFPPTFLTLCKNIATNDLSERIVPINAMVGQGIQGHTLPLSFDSWTSGVAEHAPRGRLQLRLPTVGSAELTPFLAEPSSLVCKIDVDGAEADVVAAIEPLIALDRMAGLLIECDATTRGPVEALLASAGLQVQTTHGKGNQRQVNLIAYRKAGG